LPTQQLCGEVKGGNLGENEGCRRDRPEVEHRALEQINGAEVFGEFHLSPWLLLSLLSLWSAELNSANELPRDDAGASAMVPLEALQFELNEGGGRGQQTKERWRDLFDHIERPQGSLPLLLIGESVLVTESWSPSSRRLVGSHQERLDGSLP
jgi:hypothetical protein